MNQMIFFRHLWRRYCQITPQALRINSLFEDTFGPVINDHVAFRTWAHSPISLNHIEPSLMSLGYRRQQQYTFADKHLNAWSYAHQSDEQAPLIFFSEINWHALSQPCQGIIRGIIDKIEVDQSTPDYLFGGCHWPAVRKSDYELLANESEYAGWLSVHGLQANHFTVSINELPGEVSLEKVIELLTSHHYELNTAGGVIKGSPSVLLEQASTLADPVRVTFADGEQRSVPGCFYEFARRYQDSSGRLYRGFVEANADKIFESTDRQN